MDIATAVFQQHKPAVNSEFDRKELIGEAVVDIRQFGYIEGKTSGKKWIMLKGEVTHPVDREKDDDTVMFGDEVAIFYDPEDEAKMQRLSNDMFTAGIEMNAQTQETFEESMLEAVEKKLYVRAWIGKWKDKETGEDRKKQNFKILSKDKITPELATPKVPF